MAIHCLLTKHVGRSVSTAQVGCFIGTELCVTYNTFESPSGEALQFQVSSACESICTLQDEAAVSHAAKIEKSEGQLDFTESARTLHNRVIPPNPL